MFSGRFHRHAVYTYIARTHSKLTTVQRGQQKDSAKKEYNEGGVKGGSAAARRKLRWWCDAAAEAPAYELLTSSRAGATPCRPFHRRRGIIALFMRQ